MSRGPDEWLRWQPLWDAYYLLVASAAVGAVVLESAVTPVRRAGAAALIAALVAGHLVIGRRLIRAGRGSRWSLVYQLAVPLVFAGAVALATRSAVMIFALCAPAFMTVGPVAGGLIVVALNLSWLWTADPGSLIGVAGVVAAALSIVLGVWANQIIRQSTERGELIRELEAARAELGRVSYQAGRAAEREQLADALHDTLAQGLSSTVMLLQAARAALTTDPGRARRHLELAESTSRENLADARALITARPLPEATTGSLADALRREVDRMRELTGIDASLRVDDAAGPGGTALEVELLRLAQEALSNVRKHAGAGRVEVVLAREPGRVRLEISDDGRGFTTSDTPAGHGLPLMRRRLREAGGSLEVDSAPGEGTCVRIEVPA